MSIRQIQKTIFWLVVLTIVLFNISQLVAQPNGNVSSPLIITEFMAANRNGLTDEDGDLSDWVEIYNRSNEPVNLAGWSLTDDANQPEKWFFPKITLSPDSYLLVFASGKDRKPVDAQRPLHTNFRLRRDGEVIALYNPTTRRFSDAVTVTYPPQFSDVSYGRTLAGANYGYFATPTPGEPNAPEITWTGQTTTVTFNVERGFFNTPFELELSTTTPQAQIRYTTDGSEPAETHGTRYTGPISIDQTTLLRAVAYKPGLLPADVDTHSYIFIDDVLTQSTSPKNFPTDWGTYPDDQNEYPPGSPVMPDFEMDPNIVNDPHYGPLLPETLFSLPSISLVTAAENFDIYANPQERGVEWERPVSVEFIDPQNKSAHTQINAGLRIQGGKGRQEDMPKHSFRLFFKDQYGATKFNYPLFPDSPVEEFDTLVLRGGVNGSFAATDQELATYTRDEWLRESQIEMSGVGSHGIFVHLYLNGLYWGLYNVVERPDASFAAAYYGGEKEEWHARNHNGPISGDGFWTEGARYNFKQANTPAEKYAAIEPFIDFKQFSDYVILNWYAGNIDWARKNFYYAVQNPQGRAKFFTWDGEKIWIEGAKLYFSDKKIDFGVEEFFDALIWHPDFKMVFADRLYKHLFNDGALTDENSLARWQSLNDSIAPAIIGESARWGDAKREPPYTQAEWQVLRRQVETQMQGNTAKFLALLREAGYYPPLDPPIFNQPGGTISDDFQLTLSIPEAGTVYYTLNGTDPRRPGGDISAGVVQYRGPISLPSQTVVKARAYDDGVWSALNEAIFYPTPPRRNLAITEIMYNPLNGDDYEFLEILNIGDVSVDLSNATFEGIGFTFPHGFSLPPNGIAVLIRDPAAFAEQYPNVLADGVYTKNLSNRGETISLKDPQGNVLVSVTYSDSDGWPISPDGRGDSLAVIDPTGSLDNPENWRASEYLHGSPGVDD